LPDAIRTGKENVSKSTIAIAIVDAFLLENDDGSFRLTCDVTRQYTFFTVMEDTELNTEQQVSQSEDKLWVRYAVWISRRLIQLACSATISWLILQTRAKVAKARMAPCIVLLLPLVFGRVASL